MKIAVYHDLPSGGAKRALFEFCRELSACGHIIDAYLPDTANEIYMPLDSVTDKKKIYGTAFKKNESSHAAARGFLSRWLTLYGQAICQKRIARDIDKGAYDLAFVHQSWYIQGPMLLRYLRTRSFYYMNEPLRVAYEAPLQGIENTGRTAKELLTLKIMQGIDGKNVEAASVILTNSSYSHESIMRAYGLNSIITYLAVNQEVFHKIENVEKDNFVLSVGGLLPKKGFRFLIAALGLVEERIRPGLVVVADRGEKREEEALKELAEHLGVSLEIRSGITDEELCGLYNRALFVLYAPYLEPFGLIPLESMACGTPVIAVREGGVRESVMDGETGLLVDRDETLFRDAIQYLLENKTAREAMGSNGLKNVEDRWTWRIATENLLNIFHGKLGT